MPSLITSWRIFSTSFQERFAYKIGFFLWRFRQLIATIMSLTVWTVLFNSETSLFNYSESEMITYIFLVSVLQSILLTSALHNLAGDVYSGKISTLLLKPINLFSYLSIYEASDKVLNLAFIFIEAIILYLIFQPVLMAPSLLELLLFFLWLVAGTAIHFFITLLFGAIGFWSPDVWGPKFIFLMIVDFTAGKLLPLDILPSFFQTLLYFTPFPYLSYAQTQLFLGRFDSTQILWQSLGLIFWVGALGVISVLVWKKGLKEFTAAGQ